MANINPQRSELLDYIEIVVEECSRHIGNWDDGMSPDARLVLSRLRDRGVRMLIRAKRLRGPDIGTSK